MKRFAVFLILWTLSTAMNSVSLDETTLSTANTSSDNELTNQEMLDYDDNSTEMSAVSNWSYSSGTPTAAPEIESTSKEHDLTKPTTNFPTNLSTLPPTSAFPKTDRQVSEFCSCDVTSGYCDINCCCDADCDEDDRKAFNFCSAEPTPRLETGLCFSRQFIYSNNSRLSTTKNEKGLFCISKDNLPDRIHFADQKVIDSSVKFNKIWRRRQHFTWSFQKSLPEESFSSDGSYKFGIPVWRYENTTSSIIPFVIPVAGPSPLCKSTRVVRFLENVESRCLKKVDTSHKCGFSSTDGFMDSLTLVTSPLLVNLSKPDNVTGMSFVEIRLVTCQNEHSCQTSTTLPSSEYNKTSMSCSNVPKKFHLTIYHNGTQGIVDAELKAYLANLKRRDSATRFEQIHRVTFEWARVRDGPVRRRSGTPGYLDGRPLLTNSKETTKYEESVGLFSLPKGNIGGECTSDREIVKFKHNIRTQCELLLKNFRPTDEKRFQNIQEQIWNSLFGNIKINSSDPSRLDLYISTFGDPEQFKPHDWVPVHLDNYQTNVPRSLSFSTGVSFTVAYAMIGPFTNPQAKIIGAVARMFDAGRLHCSLESKERECSVPISASVNFIDSSKTAISKFAKAPVLKIRLPIDFFYPFSSKSDRIRSECFKFALIVKCFALVFQM